MCGRGAGTTRARENNLRGKKKARILLEMTGFCDSDNKKMLQEILLNHEQRFICWHKRVFRKISPDTKLACVGNVINSVE